MNFFLKSVFLTKNEELKNTIYAKLNNIYIYMFENTLLVLLHPPNLHYKLNELPIFLVMPKEHHL